MAAADFLHHENSPTLAGVEPATVQKASDKRTTSPSGYWVNIKLKKLSNILAIKGSACNGRRNPKSNSPRRLCMVREDTGAPNEDATCAWMAADEAVGRTLAFLTMWRSSRRLVCRGRPAPGLSVNDISRIHWSQHLLTTQ
ncbi:uncharacterized protein TNCV_2739651 [Trichonephila clavipes]|nr:uncharacterized protein TNCV_2739651 [Trichonephila clavipes]